MAPAVIERPRVLHSVKDYNAAVKEIHRLLDLNSSKGSTEYDALELLSLLVEDYETRNVPEPPMPSPPAEVQFMLEQKGLTRTDLIEPLGGKSRVSEFFAGKRALSTNQIRALRDLLGVPADLLLEPAKTEADQIVSWPFRTRSSGFFGDNPSHPKAMAAKRNPAIGVHGTTRGIAASFKTVHGSTKANHGATKALKAAKKK